MYDAVTYCFTAVIYVQGSNQKLDKLSNTYFYVYFHIFKAYKSFPYEDHIFVFTYQIYDFYGLTRVSHVFCSIVLTFPSFMFQQVLVELFIMDCGLDQYVF